MGLFAYAIPAEYGGLGLAITRDVEFSAGVRIHGPVGPVDVRNEPRDRSAGAPRSGYMRETVVERLYRDVRLLRLYEGPAKFRSSSWAGS
jgi:alkylation response protein AidB-like acyl-CoA dehydrogenase